MMRQDFSFGIIPVRKTKKGFELFLVQHKAGHWSFPKGHKAENEEPKVAAARELKEESGLEILAFMPVDPIFERYFFKREEEWVQKQVTFYFAEVKGEISLQQEEISDAKWLSVEKAENQATFEETKRLCREVKNVISTLVCPLE